MNHENTKERKPKIEGARDFSSGPFVYYGNYFVALVATSAFFT